MLYEVITLIPARRPWPKAASITMARKAEVQAPKRIPPNAQAYTPKRPNVYPQRPSVYPQRPNEYPFFASVYPPTPGGFYQNVYPQRPEVPNPYETPRITSYNVCYTKLLRTFPKPVWALGVYVLLFLVAPLEQIDATKSIRRHIFW